MELNAGRGARTKGIVLSCTSVCKHSRHRFVVALATTVGLLALAPGTASAVGLDKQVKDVCRTSKDADFRAKYCTAAKDHKKGYVANISTSAVWTGVATVCGVACGKVVGGIVCKVSSMGGTAGEGVLTKKFTDSILGAGSQAAGSILKDGKAVADHGKVNGDACMTAGTSALKAYEKFSNSKQNKMGLSELREQTKGMNTKLGGENAHFAGDTHITSGDTDGSNRHAATIRETKEVCDEAALSTALGSIRCAASADPSLPAYVKSEEFLRDLQKASGKSPDAFFGGFQNPGQALADTPIVKGMSSAQQAGLADSLEAMDRYSARKVAAIAQKSGAKPAGEYRSAGGRGAPDFGAEEDLDVNGMLAGMLGQLGADGQPLAEDADAANSGGANADRQPATIISPEDRAISIFDRVKWRYGALSKSDRIGGLVP